jgi:hypothetical protein
MDEIFVTGMGATIAAIVVFCGSVWLLLTVVLGARLAYFVTASITLAFLLMMGAVWSFVQLGPVGDLPSFSAEALGEGGDVDFGAAGAFPDEPWRVPDEDDDTESTQKAEAENTATDAVGEAITAGEVESIASPDQAIPLSDSTRLLEQDDATYAAVIVREQETGGGGQQEPELDPAAEGNVLVIMQYDPGNPLGLARSITIGTFLLLVAHLFGLSRSERKVREPVETTA